jgi:hypothetical protein
MRTLLALVVTTVLVAGPVDTPFRDLNDLRQTLLRENGPLLVIMGADEPKLKPVLPELLAGDPLVDYHLRSQVVAPQDPLGKALRALPDWPAAPVAWALLTPQGSVGAGGAGIPSPGEVGSALEKAGCRPPVEALRAFVKTNPDRLDMTVLLLAELKRIGEIRTRRESGRRQPTPGLSETEVVQYGGGLRVVGKENGPAEPDAPLAPLSESQDSRIWEDYAACLERALPALMPAILRGELAGEDLVPEVLAASPRLKDAASTLIASVESALVQAPSNPSLWHLWVTFRAGGGGMDFTRLLSTLTPSPLMGDTPWPPSEVIASCVRTCREQKDWSTLCQVAEPPVRKLLDSAALGKRPANLMNPNLVPSVWTALVGPLVEAYLRQGDQGAAERTLREWLDAGGWKGASRAASAWAQASGATDLAAEWAKEAGPESGPPSRLTR